MGLNINLSIDGLKFKKVQIHMWVEICCQQSNLFVNKRYKQSSAAFYTVTPPADQ